MVIIININYKAYKYYMDNKVYFGDLEIKINDKAEKEYWLFTNQGSIKVNKDKLCKCVNIKDKNNNYIYEHDIIDIIMEENENNSKRNYQFIVKFGETEIYFNGEDPIYLNGLYLQDFEGKSYLFSKNLVDNSEYISIEGNTIENNLINL